MTAESTRALVVTAPGDSSVLRIEDRPTARPGPGELLVEVLASGVNFLEIYQREAGTDPDPVRPRFGGAGRVIEAGSDAGGFGVGDVVAWAGVGGSHRDTLVVPVDQAVPVPDGLEPEVAAAALLQGMTAHYLVSSTYPVQPGDAVLVHAAAGGTGRLIVQLAKAKGAHVIATVSTAAKQAVAEAAGADHVVRYDRIEGGEALAAAVRAANGGRGVSAVYDGVGAATFEASLGSLSRRGMLVLFGAASGPVPPFDLQRLNPAGSLYVTRPTMADYTATREELLWRAGDVLGAVADGALAIEIGGRYPLEDAARAYDDLQSRATTGKLLLTR